MKIAQHVLMITFLSIGYSSAHASQLWQKLPRISSFSTINPLEYVSEHRNKAIAFAVTAYAAYRIIPKLYAATQVLKKTSITVNQKDGSVTITFQPGLSKEYMEARIKTEIDRRNALMDFVAGYDLARGNPKGLYQTETTQFEVKKDSTDKNKVRTVIIAPISSWLK